MEWTNSFLFTMIGRDSGRHLGRVVCAEHDTYDIVAHEIYLAQQYGQLRTIAVAPDNTLCVMTSNCDNSGQSPPSAQDPGRPRHPGINEHLFECRRGDLNPHALAGTRSLT